MKSKTQRKIIALIQNEMLKDDFNKDRLKGKGRTINMAAHCKELFEFSPRTIRDPNGSFPTH
jgi:hypothetical protein